MKIFLSTLLLTINLVVSAQNAGICTIHFPTGKSQLTIQEKLRLDSLIKTFDKSALPELIIEGHTDDVGDSLFNIRLSEKRAQEVSAYFIRKKITQGIKVHSYGETKPARDNKTERNKAFNRRVDIVLNGVALSSDKSGKINTLKDLYQLIAPPPQKFCIDNNRDTLLIGAEGTIIYIPAKSFHPQAEPKHCIELRLKERYKKSLILRENLSTLTQDDQLLISGAMFEIDSDVALSGQNSLRVFAPTDTIISEVKSFQGQRDLHNVMRWTSDGTFVGNVKGGRSINEPCTKDSMRYDTTGSCKLFFCKIKDWTRIRKYVPRIDSTRITDTIPCPPAPEDYRVGINPDQLKKFPKDDLRYYVFDVSKLGWTNIDWLSKITESVKLDVHTAADANTDIKLVFKNQRSIVPFVPLDSLYRYSNAPNGYDACVVGFRVSEGKTYLAMQLIKINGSAITDLNFEEVTIDELYERLISLDK